MTTMPQYTKAELRRLGAPIDCAIDSSLHPQCTASSWDVLTEDKRAAGKKLTYRMPHIRPQSVLVTPIGNLYDEGVWARLQDMMLETAKAGHSVSIQEVRDPSLFAGDAIMLQRWQASMLARDGGVEWCFMVDNDTLVEKDTLLRLMAHDRPVMFPLLEDLERRFPRVTAPMSDPDYDVKDKGQGIVNVRWAAMSCMLIDARVFNHLEPLCWRGTDWHFAQALHNLGHRLCIDTDTVVKVTRGPSRLASLDYDEFWKSHRKMWHRLRFEQRKRGPPPGFNPETDDGMVDKWGCYFGVLNKVARNGAKPQ